MRYHFPRTLKAAEANERSQWAIGDALLVEADDRQTGERGLKAVAKELEDNGIDLGTGYLGSLRRAAEIFPANRRHALPWKVHEAAGNPDTLDVIVRAAKKTGDKVTIWYVADALKQQRDADRAEREKAKANAEREKAAAEAEERKARERERKLKEAKASAAERQHAERQRKEATKRTRDAAEKAKAAKAMPKKKDRAAPDEDEVPMMVITSTLMSSMGEAQRLIIKAEKTVGEYLDQLSPKMIAALVEDALSVANTCTRLVATLRKGSTKKGSHLSVVNE